MVVVALSKASYHKYIVVLPPLNDKIMKSNVLFLKFIGLQSSYNFRQREGGTVINVI